MLPSLSLYDIMVGLKSSRMAGVSELVGASGVPSLSIFDMLRCLRARNFSSIHRTLSLVDNLISGVLRFSVVGREKANPRYTNYLSEVLDSKRKSPLLKTTIAILKAISA